MKYSRLFTIGFVCSLLFLGACVPNAVTYYRPSMEGGEVVAVSCVPTESRVEFSLDNLSISAITNITRRTNELTVSLFLNPLTGQRIHFSSDQFKVRDIERGIQIIDTSIFASRIDGIKSPSTPFPADDSRISPLGFNFSVHISFPDTNIESFELVSPPIIIDGIETIFPVIRFQRKTWVGVSPLNC